MDIETSSAIKIFFPNPSLELVYFEAVANSLDAKATEVSIKIEIQSFEESHSLRITVIDNGVGFTDDNFDRFKTLLRPRDAYHKGVGRLVFLNYFNRVEVDSVWGDSRRTFVYKKDFDGESVVVKLPSKQPNSTKLVFSSFSNDKVKSYSYLRPEALKSRIIEHFLPTFLEQKKHGQDLRINISLKTGEENPQREFFSGDVTITQADLPVMKEVDITDQTLDVFAPVKMLYNIKDDAGKEPSLVAFNIDGRTIPAKLIQPSSIPLGYSFVCLFESEIFHSSADSSRQKLLLSEDIPENKLYALLRRKIGEVLTQHIPQISQKNTEVRKNFEKQFPHLLGYFEEESVGLIDSNAALDVAQQKFFKTQKEVLQCETVSDDIYEKSLDLSSRTLTEYILYRDKIIHRMKEMTVENKEEEIHNLIVPRFNEYSQEDMPNDVYQNNAWLLDDKFMIFRTVLSEARMDTVINEITIDADAENEAGRPDIAMIFSADPDDNKHVDVVVVEIKKKTDEEKDNQYAINQLLQRARKLAQHCPNIQRIWYYAVIQINEEMEASLLQQKWAPLFSKGKVFYQEYPTTRPNGEIVPTPTFVMSFDAIVADAECRNHTFLEILRSGMKKHIGKIQNDQGK